MLQGFEDELSPLTEFEKTVVMPMIVNGLVTKHGSRLAVTNGFICSKMNSHPALADAGYKLKETKVRQIIHYIRVNHLVPNLIAGSKGYWIESDYARILDYLKSLQQRQNQIKEIRDALIADIKKSNPTLFPAELKAS